MVPTKGDETMTTIQPGCDIVAQPINILTTKEDTMTTMSAIVYVSEKAMNEQTMLVVDTDMTYSLEQQWKNATEVERTTDATHVVNIKGVRRAMNNMVVIPCRYVQAILVSTTGLDKVKDDAHTMLGYRALADAQLYMNANGIVNLVDVNDNIVPPKDMTRDNTTLDNRARPEYPLAPSKIYSQLLEVLRWENVAMLPQYDQVKYAMRPAWNASWGITYEEYLDNMSARVPAKHHSDMTDRVSTYGVDEQYMNTKVGDDYIVPAGDDHYVYTLPKHPDGSSLGLAYLVMPAQVGRNVIHQYNILATKAIDAQNKRTNVDLVVKAQLCKYLIPKMGRSCMRDTPSRAGYHARHVKQEDNTYRNVLVTCPETRLDGTVCGGYYKHDSRGYMVCQECGVEYEMTDEEQCEELKHRLHDSHAEYTPENVNNDYDLEDHMAALDAEAAYAATSYTQDKTNDTNAPVVTAASVARARTLGGEELDGKLGAMAARLDRNIEAWRAAVNQVPADEQRAKDRAHEKAQRDAECKKANAAAKRAKRVDAGRDLYENKWGIARKNYAMRVLLAMIKSGVTDTKAMLQYLPPHCGRETYEIYRRELVAAGRITITSAGHQRVMAIVPVERPVHAQYPAKYDGRAKYGNLEYKRGTIQPAVGLYAAKPAREYTPVERPLWSEYNSQSTNSDELGAAPLYRTGKECLPARSGKMDMTADEQAAEDATQDAWYTAYTRKLVYELVYARTMINKGQ